MTTLNPEAASFQPTSLNLDASSFQPNTVASDCPGSVAYNHESSQPTIIELTPIFESADPKLQSSVRRRNASDPGPVRALEELALDFQVPAFPYDVYGPPSPVPSLGAGEGRLNDWTWDDSHKLPSEVCICQDCTDLRWRLEHAMSAEESYFQPMFYSCPEPVYQEAPYDPMFNYPHPWWQATLPAREPPVFGPVPVDWTPESHCTYTTVDNALVPVYGPSGFIMEYSPYTERCMQPTVGDEETEESDEFYLKPDIDHNARTAAGRAILEAQATLQDYQTDFPAFHPENSTFYSDEFAACYYEQFPAYFPEQPYYGQQESGYYPNHLQECYSADLGQEQTASPVETNILVSPRLKLAWQPFIKRARNLGVSDEDLQAAGHAEHM